MMEIQQEVNLVYGLQMWYTIQIIYGVMEAREHICFIIVLHQHGGVLV